MTFSWVALLFIWFLCPLQDSVLYLSLPPSYPDFLWAFVTFDFSSIQFTRCEPVCWRWLSMQVYLPIALSLTASCISCPSPLSYPPVPSGSSTPLNSSTLWTVLSVIFSPSSEPPPSCRLSGCCCLAVCLAVLLPCCLLVWNAALLYCILNESLQFNY